MLKLYFENPTFGVITSKESTLLITGWFGRVSILLVIGGSNRVGLEIWWVGSGHRKWTR